MTLQGVLSLHQSLARSGGQQCHFSRYTLRKVGPCVAACWRPRAMLSMLPSLRLPQTLSAQHVTRTWWGRCLRTQAAAPPWQHPADAHRACRPISAR